MSKEYVSLEDVYEAVAKLIEVNHSNNDNKPDYEDEADKIYFVYTTCIDLKNYLLRRAKDWRIDDSYWHEPADYEEFETLDEMCRYYESLVTK